MPSCHQRIDRTMNSVLSLVIPTLTKPALVVISSTQGTTLPSSYPPNHGRSKPQASTRSTALLNRDVLALDVADFTEARTPQNYVCTLTKPGHNLASSYLEMVDVHAPRIAFRVIIGSGILDHFFLLGRACGFEISRYMSVVIFRRAARQFRAVAPTDPLQTGSGGPGISR
jgi:hypothetical protein